MIRWKIICPISTGFLLTLSGWGQSNFDTNATSQSKEEKHQPGAVKEIGAGAGAVGTGAAKGTAAAAKGTAKGAADLVTLHPIDASASVGKGAATAGKDVTVGAAKGTGKVAKGIGRTFKKLF
jgi:hypothetical protein